MDAFTPLKVVTNLSELSNRRKSTHLVTVKISTLNYYTMKFVAGNLSAIDFLPADPSAKYRTVIAFFIAGISSKSPIRLFSFAPVVFVSSDIDVILRH